MVAMFKDFHTLVSAGVNSMSLLWLLKLRG